MVTAINQVPYWRLSAFYLSYLGLLGGFIPYWNLYLARELHFSPLLIGQLMALTMFPRLLAPCFWGRIADRSGRVLTLVRVGAFMLTLFWLALSFTHSFRMVAILLLGCTFFQNAVMAQFEVVTLTHLGKQCAYYGRVRLWGSLGFMAMVMGLGLLFDRLSLRWLPLILATAALATWLASLCVPDTPVKQVVTSKGTIWHKLRRPEVVGFLGAVFLLQVAHAPYYAFYSVYLASSHYSHQAIGALWALGIAAEVLAFTQMHRLLGCWGLRKVLLGALLLAAVRWWGIGYGVNDLTVLITMQLLHAASFAAVHAVSVQLITHYFGENLRGQGQAIYGLLWGLGTSLGAWVTGSVWNSLGPSVVFGAATAITLMSWVCVYRAVQVPSTFNIPEAKPA